MERKLLTFATAEVGKTYEGSINTGLLYTIEKKNKKTCSVRHCHNGINDSHVYPACEYKFFFADPIEEKPMTL